jgi:hypothetical protein
MELELLKALSGVLHVVKLLGSMMSFKAFEWHMVLMASFVYPLNSSSSLCRYVHAHRPACVLRCPPIQQESLCRVRCEV